MNESSFRAEADAAAVYEEFFVPALFGQWAQPVLNAAGVQAGDRVLDVACGTGVLSRAAVELVAPAGSVTGLDASRPGSALFPVRRCRCRLFEYQDPEWNCALSFGRLVDPHRCERLVSTWSAARRRTVRAAPDRGEDRSGLVCYQGRQGRVSDARPHRHTRHLAPRSGLG